MKLSPKKHYAGFTLLELIIAISIFSILGLGSYRLLKNETLTQQHLLNQSNEHQQWLKGVQKLQQDLIQATHRSIRNSSNTLELPFIGDSEKITFTRNGWINPLNHQRSNLQRITYEWVEPDGNNRQLVRDYWLVLDPSYESTKKRQVLIENVEAYALRYLDHEGDWHKTWPTSTGDDLKPGRPDPAPLPIAVEFRLYNQHLGEIVQLVPLGNKIYREDSKR